MENKYQIFKKGSKTFFYSSLFFPKEKRQAISTLYAFVRTADDFVDQTPPLAKDFYDFKNQYYLALQGKISNLKVIDEFIFLQKKYDFDQDWIDAFFKVMQSDLSEVRCKDLSETNSYMYGSASVIGFMLCKILEIKPEAYIYADKLGQAFQYINFIRDIAEDNALNRQYLPEVNLQKYSLENLLKEHVMENQANFIDFIRKELDYFYLLIKESKGGFAFIPWRYRMPIEIATNLYIYTARIIYKNPLIVYQCKVKPSRWRIFLEAVRVILRQ